MSQSAPTGGRRLAVYLQAVRAKDVLKNKRLKLLGVALSDWIVCSQCNKQQSYHCHNGGDFDKSCWSCGASHKSFVYFDELARSVPPETTLYRLNRR